jgi:Uma2 family endonuclease
MSTTPTLMTADDLLRLPDDGLRHELVNGELRTMTPSGSEHSVITARLARVVDGFVSSRDLGLVFGAEGGFRISTGPDTVRAPDLAFVHRERIPESGIPKGYWPGAPDLAAEVVSPGETYGEVEGKVSAWLDAGTAVVWVLDPARRSVAVHEAGAGVRILSAADELTGGTVLPGLACPVAELFP